MEIVRTPIYQQLHEVLKQRILSGVVRPGEKFLTEREIAQEFNVSRATANKVLSSLVSEGFVEFKKGIGTFVDSNLNTDMASMSSFTEKVKSAGRNPSSRVLLFRRIRAAEAGQETMDQMKVSDPETELYEMKRLRMADGSPMILSHRFILASVCPGLTAEDMKGSFFGLLRERFNVRMIGADEIYRAVIIQGREAELLQVPSGEPGFLVTTTGFLDEERILWIEHAIFRPDAFEFRCQVRPLHSSKDFTIDIMKQE